MTREEAIKNLKWLLECSYVDSFEDAENEALRMAIKALEQGLILEKIFYIVHPLSIMSTDKLEHEVIMQIAEMLEPLYLLESEDKE